MDYYKTVWLKRVKDGSIDLKALGSEVLRKEEEEVSECCIFDFGEHIESNPNYCAALQMGAKVLLSCSNFEHLDYLQPFHVAVSKESLLLADFHCNLSNAEAIGYFSGSWTYDKNCLRMLCTYPCHLILQNATIGDCYNERNRVAVDIHNFNHDVVGWYHSHPRTAALPSLDDINRQLEYQIMMKGANESSYIPCVGLIISPICYSQEDCLTKSPVQAFWVLPPSENQPMDIGRPMNIEFEVVDSEKIDKKCILEKMKLLVGFYKEKKDVLDVNEFRSSKFETLQMSLCSWAPELSEEKDFWLELKSYFLEGNTKPCKHSSDFSRENSFPVSCSECNISKCQRLRSTPESPITSTPRPLNNGTASSNENCGNEPSNIESGIDHEVGNFDI